MKTKGLLCLGPVVAHCLLIFPVVAKHPNKGNLRMEGFIWAIGTSPSWWQQLEAVGHNTLAVRKQREKNAITQLTSIQSRVQSMTCCFLHLGRVIFSYLTYLKWEKSS